MVLSPILTFLLDDTDGITQFDILKTQRPLRMYNKYQS